MPCTAFYINIPDVQQTLLIIQHGVVLAGTAACLFGDCLMHWRVAFHTFDNFKWGLESFSYDKVSANGATSEPQCNKKSDVSQDTLGGSINVLNQPYQLLSEYVWHTIGKNWPFGQEISSCAIKHLIIAYSGGHKSGLSDFGRPWTPYRWHQVMCWVIDRFKFISRQGKRNSWIG